MNEYHFLDESTDLTKAELIKKIQQSHRRHLVLTT